MKKNKKIAVIQSNYVPWKGYFDIIAGVDEFVVLDSVQYSRGSFRNRNQIITDKGPDWITIPIHYKFGQPIADVQVAKSGWAESHWSKILNSYQQAEHFDEFKNIFQKAYEKHSKETSLSKINLGFIKMISDLLGIKTKISVVISEPGKPDPNERLIKICQAFGASEYLSGPKAKVYLDTKRFADLGINVNWVDYSGYKPYKQLGKKFYHEVSIMDLIFNIGREAKSYMKCVK